LKRQLPNFPDYVIKDWVYKFNKEGSAEGIQDWIDSLHVDVYDTTMAFKDELNDYLSSKMSVDPQITLFFHNN
jgi:hypothetical protein